MGQRLVNIEELSNLLGIDRILIEELIMNGMPYFRMNRAYREVQKYKIQNCQTRHKNKLFDYDVCERWIRYKLI